LILATVAVALGGNAHALPALPDVGALGGTSWQLAKSPVSTLATMSGLYKQFTPKDKPKYTITFGADGRVSVRLDCNRGTATWMSDRPGALQLGSLAMTRALCAKGSLSGHIATDLSEVKGYMLSEGRLVLVSDLVDSDLLEFEPLEAPPSFDCAKAGGDVERLVCGDKSLAWLDRKLANVYSTALKKGPESESATLKKTQRAWVASRNDCRTSKDVKACARSSYELRIAEVEIRSPLLSASINARYVCPDNTTLVAAYYNQTDPPAALFTYGNAQIVANVLPSGSGARYGASDFDFWEHQGEARVNWSGKNFTCKVSR
jgi:uncharacterized protein/heat shock protein HslJ